MAGCTLAAATCSPNDQEELSHSMLEPREVIDLGALVTEDLPERVWGKGYLTARGYTRPNTFHVISWDRKGIFNGSNAYYTLFNHGGPHVDAPKHMGFEGGLDSYPIESFAGPLKVIDVTRFAKGFTVTRETFEGFDIRPHDIVIIYTRYTPPETDEAFPETIALTREAAEYLAEMPVRALGTDAWSVGNAQDDSPVDAATEHAREIPVHHSFLSRRIPVYEQLFNVDQLLGKENMYFVGVPLNIRGGDGMIVRPVVIVY
jgi:kynurenine formamidase